MNNPQPCDNTTGAATLAVKAGNEGLELAEAGRTDEALACLDRALTLAREHNLQEIECDALGNLGLVHVDLGDPRAGIAFLEKALALVYTLDDKPRLQLVLGNLGNTHLLIADLEKATDYYRQALALARELADAAAECGYLNNLGTVFLSQNMFEAAIDCFERQLNVARGTQNTDTASMALINLGKAYTKQANQLGNMSLAAAENGAKNDALKFAQDAVHAARKTDDKSLLASQLVLSAFAWRDLGNKRDALVDCEKALELFDLDGSEELALNARRLLEELRDELQQKD